MRKGEMATKEQCIRDGSVSAVNLLVPSLRGSCQLLMCHIPAHACFYRNMRW